MDITTRPRLQTSVIEGRQLIVAHRGASRMAQENSLLAFEIAADMGADMAELDVRRTSDGVLVVHHNATVRGTPLSHLTYADLRWRRRRVGVPPTFDEVLRNCTGRICLDVELKGTGYEHEVVRLLRRHFRARDFVITSFRDDVIATVKTVDPDVEAGLLIGSRRARPHDRLFGLSPVVRARRCDADFLAPHHLLADAALLSRARREGLPLLVWTVNRPRRVQHFLAYPEVMGIVTDTPDIALAVRDQGTVKRRTPPWRVRRSVRESDGSRRTIPGPPRT